MKYLVIINLESGICFIEKDPELQEEELEEYIDQNFGKMSSISWGIVNELQIKI